MIAVVAPTLRAHVRAAFERSNAATTPDKGRRLGRQTMPQTLEPSTAMAIHAMWLMARACNIGVGMVSIINPERIEALFDVPKTWRFTACFCLGYPEFDDDMPLLHRADWQQNTPTRWQTR